MGNLSGLVYKANATGMAASILPPLRGGFARVCPRYLDIRG